MSEELVQITVNDAGIATLTLNRPEKLNALSKNLLVELKEALIKMMRAASQQKIRVLLLRSSNPKAFCVGADLTERLNLEGVQVLRAVDDINDVVDRLEALPVPTVCIIEGAAFGGGLELALAADMRIASPAAQMGLTETKLAIIPGAGGTQRLAHLVGVSKAKEMILLGKRISGTEAERIRLVNAVDENPLVLAEQWAQEIVSAGPAAIRAAKKAIHGGAHLPLEKGLAWERQCYKLVLKTQDRVEGLKAFSEKRKPVYQGK